MPGVVVDGQDAVAVAEAVDAAVGRARGGGGPTFIEAKTYRLRGHFEGDPQQYRTEEEVGAWRARDPIELLGARLVEEQVCTVDDLTRVRVDADAEMDAAVGSREARAATDPRPHLRRDPGVTAIREITFVDAIREALHEEMARDDRVFVMGEDVGAFGGVFGATRGLQATFGERRVFDTPLSETLIAGAAVGAALTGLRPVAELQYSDFVAIAMDELYNKAAKWRFMHGGCSAVPMVVRAPEGAKGGGGAEHSQSPGGLFPERIRHACADALEPRGRKGLLKSAIRDDNPVLFLEHKALYSKRGSGTPRRLRGADRHRPRRPAR